MLANATVEALDRLTQLFQQAARMPGRPRERIVAISQAEELFFRMHPYHYRALQLIRVASQVSQTGRKSDGPLRPCESRLMSHLMSVIQEAARCGDLRMVDAWEPEELAFSLWALAFGTRVLMETTVAVRQLGIRNGFKTSRQTMDLLLDALDWRPLSSEWDYEQTRKRAVSFLLSDQAAEPRTGS